jgi:peptide/nickel transport system substrate-binding protein
VKLVFKGPTPFWADAFCSNAGMILPRHVFESCRGARSREAPANLAPTGTGPTGMSRSSRATSCAPISVIPSQ